MTEKTILIEGMHCDNCVTVVRKALSDVDGVDVDTVEIGRAVIRVDPAEGSLEAAEKAIVEEGYHVVPSRVSP